MLVFVPALSSGQYAYQAVFPALTGDALANEVRAAFTPETVIPYAFARDTLFKNRCNKPKSLLYLYRTYLANTGRSGPNPGCISQWRQ